MNEPKIAVTQERPAALPALRGLARLGDVVPVLVVDNREQEPLKFSWFKSMPGTLTTGDYSVAGLEDQFAVERKTISDLVGCCVGESRERFERELHRLRGFRFKRLLIVGTRAEVEQHQYRSNVQPKVVLNTLAAFEVRYDTPIVWVPDAVEAARCVETWAWWFSREVVNAGNNLLRGCERDGEPAKKTSP